MFLVPQVLQNIHDKELAISAKETSQQAKKERWTAK